MTPKQLWAILTGVVIALITLVGILYSQNYQRVESNTAEDMKVHMDHEKRISVVESRMAEQRTVLDRLDDRTQRILEKLK